MTTLYIVATPIGNLKDISQRALDVLANVELIVAEDTRHSKKLLSHYNINTQVTSLHNFNESNKSQFLLNELQQGHALALISDAGTPLISDPGYPLVAKARQAGITIVPIPGCCALIAALSASGLATDRFYFEGFLPAKSESRFNKLTMLSKEPKTLCFYEAPHRLLDCLLSMQQAFGATRNAVVAKEISKSYEQFFSGEISQLIEQFQQNKAVIKGEFVILVEGARQTTVEKQTLISTMEVLLSEKLSTKQAASIAAKLLGCKKKEAYQVGVELTEKPYL